MSETLVNKLDKLVEDSNIYNKEQSKTQKELNEENEALRQCIESELEDVTVEGTEITIDDAANYYAKIVLKGNKEQASASLNNPQDIHTVHGLIHLKLFGANLFNWETCIKHTKINAQGNLYSVGSDDFSSDFIEVIPNWNIRLHGSTYMAIAEYDSNKNILNYIQPATSVNDYTMTTSSDTKYIRFCVGYYTQHAKNFEVYYTDLDWPLTKKYIKPKDFYINLGDEEIFKIENIPVEIYKENGKWYFSPKFKQVVENANQFARAKVKDTTETKYYFYMNLNKNIEEINWNYTQEALTNYGKANAPYRSTARGLVEGFNVGGSVLALYSEEYSTMGIEEFKTIWNEKLATEPLTIYAKSKDAIEITDNNLLEDLEIMAKELKTYKESFSIISFSEGLAPTMKITYKKTIRSQIDELKAMVLDNS